jgi:hypothetical protein
MARFRLHEQVMDLNAVEENPEALKTMERPLEDPDGIGSATDEVKAGYDQGKDPEPAENPIEAEVMGQATGEAGAAAEAPEPEEEPPAQALHRTATRLAEERGLPYDRAFSQAGRERPDLVDRYRRSQPTYD